MAPATLQKIRVVFVINDFLMGGAQRQLARQLRLYNRDTFDVTIITLFHFPDKQTLYHLIPDDIAVEKMAFSGFFDLRSLFRFCRILNKLRPDIVVSSLFFSNTLTRLLRVFFGYRSIAREHNTYTYKRRWAILVDRWLARQSYKMVAVSEEVATFTIRQESIPQEKFVVIQNGIDLDEIAQYRHAHATTAKEILYNRHHLEMDRKILLNVSRLTEQKNLVRLIEAFAQFSAKHEEYVLFILGEGGLFLELQSLIQRLGMGGRIFLVGAVHDIGLYYLVSEMLVSASLIEGLSNAHLEALAFGLPIIITETGGAQELLRPGENGWCIPGYTKEDILGALEHVSRQDISSWRVAALRTATQFDIRHTVHRYEDLFIRCYNNAV